MPEGEEEGDMSLFLSRSLLLIEIPQRAASKHFNTLPRRDTQNAMI